ncbi:MAG: aminopeptidase [Deltaproteobacteria bacterium]|jgi:aspartyl aminopeptidase|nr:aminopeptidase [Deltaproteobacteria bacterium]
MFDVTSGGFKDRRFRSANPPKSNPPAEDDKEAEGKPNLGVWEKLTSPQRAAAEKLAQEYREFLSTCKTERTVGSYILQKAKEAGFKDLLGKDTGFKGGYLTHHGKLLGLATFGGAKERPLDQGFNLIVAHGDSPRLDLKPRCLYEESGLGLFKSNLYGGLKKFQWLARPLALWGFAVLKDGREINIRFGEEPGDPVLTITDILPHLDSKVQRDKKLIEAFPAERLNVLAGSRAASKGPKNERVKKALKTLLLNKWGLEEDDLISSELELVPAGPAREVGLDGSLIGGYGQDDRLSVFVALKALLDNPDKNKPALLIVFDREEIGSYGSTGAETNFVTRLVAAVLEKAGVTPTWRLVTETLAKSLALSADVEAALDPTFKEVHDELNAALLGHGPCLVRYTGGAGKYGASEARAEYMAKIRRLFDENDILWQSTLLGKQEYGGGGTVALSLAYHGLSVVDCGAPVLSMHSPFEITSKADIYMTLKAMTAFYLKA